MAPIKTARLMRGVSQAELARQIGVLPQSLNQYESGARMPGPKMLPLIADALGVSAAYLRGDAQRLPLRDFMTGELAACAIMLESVLDQYGIFYVVEHEDVGPVAVILADGVQFTLPDWQGEQPLEAGAIAEYTWVDAAGRAAVMMDGLPRMIWR